MPTLISVLKEHYTKVPDRLFCRFIADGNAEDIAYRKLIENSASYAFHYKNNGVAKGDSVIIILKHTPHLFYSFIGAMMIGSIPSILPFPSEKQDALLYRDSIEKLSKRIGAKSIVTYKENLAEIEPIAKALGIGAIIPERISGASEAAWPVNIREEDIAFLQHSSGTTGLKKGVALSHKAVLNQIGNYSKSIGLNSKDVIVSWLPLYHDMGLIACFIMPLISKTPVVMIDPFEWISNPGMLFEGIEKNRATLCWLPNFAYNLLVQYIGTSEEKYNLSSMRAIIDCSEPCKAHSFEMFYSAFKKYGIKMETLQTCYAMAENVFGITQSEISRKVKIDYVNKDAFISRHYAAKSKSVKGSISFLSVGNAIPNTEAGIVDSKRKELGERHVGEIRIRSNSLFSGYFRLPEESAKSFESGWFYTGDLGYVAEGEIYITGRKKDLIIVHGKNYYAHDIEYTASHVHGVKKGRCAAIGIYNDRIGSEDAVLIAEAASLSSNGKARIIKEIKKRVSCDLNLLLKDVCIVPLKWLVKTTSGKISRNENKRKYLKEMLNIEAED